MKKSEAGKRGRQDISKSCGDEFIEDDCAVNEDEQGDVETLGEEYVREEDCEDLEQHFGNEASNNGGESDGESEDDIWNDDDIPDPISSDQDEEVVARKYGRANEVEAIATRKDVW
ncbi:unnamed protein product [Cochlearia groenlandica]